MTDTSVPTPLSLAHLAQTAQNREAPRVPYDGKLLRELRLRAELPSAFVAAVIGVDVRTLHRWEATLYRPTPRKLASAERVLAALGTVDQ